MACFRLVRRAEAGPLVTGLARLMKIWLAGGVLSVAALGIEFLDIDLPMSGDAVGGLGLMCFVYATALLALRVPLGYRPQAEPAPAPKPRYANSRLSDADRSQFLASLTQCMEGRQLFRDGELSLEQLAAEVAVTPHELSQLINDACGANFQEYLNRYRVAALQRALHDPRQAGDSILDLALASGFNSKSALNRAFKKQTGVTPSEFRGQRRQRRPSRFPDFSGRSPGKHVPNHHLRRAGALPAPDWGCFQPLPEQSMKPILLFACLISLLSCSPAHGCRRHLDQQRQAGLARKARPHRDRQRADRGWPHRRRRTRHGGPQAGRRPAGRRQGLLPDARPDRFARPPARGSRHGRASTARRSR